MPPHETRIRVRYAETDQMGVVYYANYLVWMEVGRVEYCKACGFEYKQMELEDGVFLAVAEARCRYASPARFDEEVVIRTWVGEANPRMVLCACPWVSVGALPPRLSGAVRRGSRHPHVGGRGQPAHGAVRLPNAPLGGRAQAGHGRNQAYLPGAGPAAVQDAGKVPGEVRYPCTRNKSRRWRVSADSSWPESRRRVRRPRPGITPSGSREAWLARCAILQTGAPGCGTM